MEPLFTKLLELFSVGYMFSVIVASYLVIKLVDAVNGNKVVPSWAKCLVTCIMGIILFVVFYLFTEETLECLITSFFAAVFVYDKAIKLLIEKFNMGYRK